MLVAHLQIGMMIFAMRNPRQGIDKGHGLVKIFKGKGARKGLLVATPVGDLCEKRIGLRRRESIFTPLAWFACAMNEVVHGLLKQ